MSASRPSGERTALLVILLAAFSLRVYALASQSLWYDEGVSAWLAQQPLPTTLAWTADDVQPPLYYLLLGGWASLAGISEYSLRFVSAFCALLAVPLLYRLARLASPGGAAPLWAAALAAFHPLLIYYAQEARMYALLMALSLSAAILFLPAQRGSMAWSRWIAYAAVSILEFYTHYFALFLILAFALAWAIGFARHRADMLRFLLANALIVAGFAPWLVATARNLSVDTSYWLGQFDLLDALHDIAIRFVAGETVPEQRAIWIAVALLAVTLAGFLWLWWQHSDGRPILLLAGLWLLFPVTATLILASIAPKFNPRYVLIALPGVLLIWALLLAGLARPPTRGGRWMTLALTIALFAPFVWSSGNWYFDPVFAKAQWRQLAEFLRPRRTADEALILVSGHAWPVWDYYAPDMPAQPIPALDVLDVNAVLNFENSAGPLREALADKSGAWLIGWQDEIVDPNDVVPTQLELAGREKGSTARFHLLSLRRFSRIHAHRTADAPPVTVPNGAEFGGRVRFDGYHALDNGDLLLFWSTTAATASGADERVAIEVLNGEGQLVAHVADRRLGGYTYPTFRWQPGEVVMGRIPASEWLGDAPSVADYTLRLRVYDGNDATMAPLTLPDGSEALTVTGVRPVLE